MNEERIELPALKDTRNFAKYGWVFDFNAPKDKVNGTLYIPKDPSIVKIEIVITRK